jgi:Holliday junction resolvase RusA-like endonuclease
MKEIKIIPVAKPRMTRSDKWKVRPATSKYWAFKDELVMKCNLAGIKIDYQINVVFIMPMPESWSNKRKFTMEGMPHFQKPDCDNLIKSVGDCLLKDDSKVWKISAEKYWGTEGKIIFK